MLEFQHDKTPLNSNAVIKLMLHRLDATPNIQKLLGCYMVKPHDHTYQLATHITVLPHLAYQRRSLRRIFRELKALLPGQKGMSL